MQQTSKFCLVGHGLWIVWRGDNAEEIISHTAEHYTVLSQCTMRLHYAIVRYTMHNEQSKIYTARGICRHIVAHSILNQWYLMLAWKSLIGWNFHQIVTIGIDKKLSLYAYWSSETNISVQFLPKKLFWVPKLGHQTSKPNWLGTFAGQHIKRCKRCQHT